MGIGIGVVAQAPEIVFAEEAVPHAMVKGITTRSRASASYFVACFFYHSHEFVTENISRLHRGNQTSVEVKMAATDGVRVTLMIASLGLMILRFRHFMHFDRFLAHPTDGLYRFLQYI